MFTDKDFFDFIINNDISRIVVPIKKSNTGLSQFKQEKKLSEKKLTLLRKQQRSLKQSVL
jgi:hypothetical protein